jgi:hypothetical protein
MILQELEFSATVIRKIFKGQCHKIFCFRFFVANHLPPHCKKELAIFPSPAGMSLTKLSLGGKKLNYSRPGRV